MDEDFAEAPVLARIDEAVCIGCTLCVDACPVDAIVGAAKLMHTVLADRCTGCALCLPPCPVDCIALATRERAWTRAHAERAQRQVRTRAARLASARRDALARSASPAPGSGEALRAERRAAVAAALARARARRARRPADPV